MKKLFSLLSIIFALIAGFSACGGTKTQTDTDVSDNEVEDSDDSGNTGNTGDPDDSGNTGNTGDTGNSGNTGGDTGDTFYGVAYSEFVKHS